jgi:hypothetical protein
MVGGGISKQRITGDGAITFTAPKNDGDPIFGFLKGHTSMGLSTQDRGYANNADFAFYFDGNKAFVYEGGVQKLSLGSYVRGEEFRIDVADGQVNYFRNRAIVYTSKIKVNTSINPLMVDVFMQEPGSIYDTAYVEYNSTNNLFTTTYYVSGAWYDTSAVMHNEFQWELTTENGTEIVKTESGEDLFVAHWMPSENDPFITLKEGYILNTLVSSNYECLYEGVIENGEQYYGHQKRDEYPVSMKLGHPDLDISGDDTVCFGLDATLCAVVDDTSKYTYKWEYLASRTEFREETITRYEYTAFEEVWGYEWEYYACDPDPAAPLCERKIDSGMYQKPIDSVLITETILKPIVFENNTACVNVGRIAKNETYRVWITDKEDGCSNTARAWVYPTDSIYIEWQPTVKYQNLCQGDSIELSIARVFGGDDGEHSFEWKSSKGWNSGIKTSFTDTARYFLATGADTIVGYFYAYNGKCVYTDTVIIENTEGYNVEIGNGDTALLCQGESLELYVASSSATAKYTWTPVAIKTNSVGDTATIKPNATTLYRVDAVDEYGCHGKDSIYVKIYRQDNAGEFLICANEDSVMFDLRSTASFGEYDSIIWSPAFNISDINSFNPYIHRPEKDTFYTIQVFSKSKPGCNATVKAFVNVQATPVISWYTKPELYCIDSTVEVHVLDNGYDTLVAKLVVSKDTGIVYHIHDTATGCSIDTILRLKPLENLVLDVEIEQRGTVCVEPVKGDIVWDPSISHNVEVSGGKNVIVRATPLGSAFVGSLVDSIYKNGFLEYRVLPDETSASFGLSYTTKIANGRSDITYSITIEKELDGRLYARVYNGSTFRGSLVVNVGDVINVSRQNGLIEILVNGIVRSTLTEDKYAGTLFPIVYIPDQEGVSLSGLRVVHYASLHKFAAVDNMPDNHSMSYKWYDSRGVLLSSDSILIVDAVIAEEGISVIGNSGYPCLTCDTASDTFSFNGAVPNQYPVIFTFSNNSPYACLGENIEFVVKIDSSSIPTGAKLLFNWFVNGVSVITANPSAIVNIPNLKQGDIVIAEAYISNLEGSCRLSHVSSPAQTGWNKIGEIGSYYAIGLSAPDSTCAGMPTTFKVAATGAGRTPSFQWYKNNTLLADEIFSTYTTSNYNSGDSIWVIVRASADARCIERAIDTSNKLAITVVPNPVVNILNPTKDTLVDPLQKVNLIGSVTGSYSAVEWLPAQSGSNNLSLTVAPRNTTTYTLRAINALGCHSNEDMITVNVFNCPVIKTQSLPATLCIGENATFSVNVMGDTSGMLYEWQKSSDFGANYNTIEVNKKNTFNITGITAAHDFAAGNMFRVRLISNEPACDTSVSAPMIINVRNSTPPVQPTITLLGDSIFCLNDPQIYYAVDLTTPVSGVSWYVNGGLVASGIAAYMPVKVTSGDVIVVEARTENDCGVVLLAKDSVTIFGCPDINIPPIDDIVIGRGKRASMRGNLVKYTGDDKTPIPEFEPEFITDASSILEKWISSGPITKTTRVKVSAKDSNGCYDETYFFIMVEDTCLDSLALSIDKEIADTFYVTEGEDIKVSAILDGGMGNMTYNWSSPTPGAIVVNNNIPYTYVTPVAPTTTVVLNLDLDTVYSSSCPQKSFQTEIVLKIQNKQNFTAKLELTGIHCVEDTATLRTKVYIDGLEVTDGLAYTYHRLRAYLDEDRKEIQGSNILTLQDYSVRDRYYVEVKNMDESRILSSDIIYSDTVQIPTVITPTIIDALISVRNLSDCVMDSSMIFVNLGVEQIAQLEAEGRSVNYTVDSGLTWHSNPQFNHVKGGWHYVGVRDNYGCSAPNFTPVYVHVKTDTLPAITAGNDTNYCIEESRKDLWASGLVGEAVMRWYLSNSPNQPVFYQGNILPGDSLLTGSRIYFVRQETSNCYSDFVGVKVNVNSNKIPQIALSAHYADGRVCEGDEVRYELLTQYVGTNPIYHWYLNGVEIAGQTSSTYLTDTLKDKDSVKVIVEITDPAMCLANGAPSSATVALPVLDRPVVAVCCDTTISLGDSATLVATVTPVSGKEANTTLKWTPGLRITSDTASTIKAFPMGKQEYTATATDGTCFGSAKVVVRVEKCPSITASSLKNNTVCEGDDLRLWVIVDSGNQQIGITWQESKDGSTWTTVAPSQNSDTLLISNVDSASVNGKYYRAQVEHLGHLVCEQYIYSSAMRVFVADTLTTPTIKIVGDTAFCSADYYTLTAVVAGANAEDVIWTVSGSATVQGKSVVLRNDLINPGPDYKVIASVKSAGGCGSAGRDTVTVTTIRQRPVISVGPDTFVDRGVAANTVLAEPSAIYGTTPYSFSWKPAPSAPTMYSTSFLATVSDAYGCTDSAEQKVDVRTECLDSIRERIFLETGTICLGPDNKDSVIHATVYITGPSPLNIEWILNGDAKIKSGQGTKDLYFYPPTTPNTYWVEVRVSDRRGAAARGCKFNGKDTVLTDRWLYRVGNPVSPTIALSIENNGECAGLDSLVLKTVSNPSYAFNYDYYAKRNDTSVLITTTRENTVVIKASEKYTPLDGDVFFVKALYNSSVPLDPGKTGLCPNTVVISNTVEYKESKDLDPFLLPEYIATNSLIVCSIDTPSIEVNLPWEELPSKDSEGMQYSIDSGKTWQTSNVFKPVAEGEYNVWLLTADGCEYHFPFAVTVIVEPDAPLAAPVAGTDSVYCPDQEILPLWVIDRGFRAVWTTGTEIKPGTHTYYVHLEGYNCVSPSTGVEVTLRTDNVKLALTSNISGNTVCDNEETVITLTSQNTGGAAINWYRNGVLIPGETGNTLTINNWLAGDSIKATVTITDATRCDYGKVFTSAVISPSVKKSPVVTASGSTIIKDGDSTAINAVVTGGYSEFKWSPGGSTLSNPSALSTYAHPSVTTMYRASAMNAAGCYGEDTILIRVEGCPRIVAQSFAIGDSVCEGGNTVVWANVEEGGNTVIREWQVSEDGGTEWTTLPDNTVIGNTTLNYSTSGDSLLFDMLRRADVAGKLFRIKAYALDNASCTDTVYSNSKQVNVKALPAASIPTIEIIGDSTPCESDNYTLSANVSNASLSSVVWLHNGDPVYYGTTLNLSSSVMAAPYEVTAMVTSGNSCIAALNISDTFTITSIKSKPYVTALPDSIVEKGFIPSTALRAKVSGGTAPYSIVWSPDTSLGIVSTTLFTATATDAEGCSGSGSTILRVADSCMDSVSFALTDGSIALLEPICSSTTEFIYASALVSGGQQKNKYEWSVNNGAVIEEGQGSERIKIRIPETDFKVTVKVTDIGALSGYCSSNGYITTITKSRDIDVASPTTPVISVSLAGNGGSTVFCANSIDSISLQSTVSPAGDYTVEYFLVRGDTNLSIGTGGNLITIYNNSFAYGIKNGDKYYGVAKGSASSSCPYTAGVKSNIVGPIEIKPLPYSLSESEIVAGSLLNCSIDTPFIEINLPMKERSGVEYSIDGGINWQPSNLFKPLAAGIYQIALRKDGCVNEFDGEVELKVNEGVIPAPVAGTDSIYCSGQTPLPLWVIDNGFRAVWTTDTEIKPGTHTYYVHLEGYNCVSPSTGVTVSISTDSIRSILTSGDIVNSSVCGQKETKILLTYQNAGVNPDITWYRNGMLIAGATGNTITINDWVAGDSVYASIFVTDINRCDYGTVHESKAIKPNVKASPKVVASGSTTIKQNDSTEISAIVTGSYSKLTWTPNSSVVNASALVTKAYPSTTTVYRATAEYDGCYGYDTIIIKVEHCPSIAIQSQANPAAICETGTAILWTKVNAGGNTLVKEWQVSEDGGLTWNTLANGDIIGTNTTVILNGINDSLLLDEITPADLSGKVFRQKVYSVSSIVCTDTIYSNIKRVNVNALPAILPKIEIIGDSMPCESSFYSLYASVVGLPNYVIWYHNGDPVSYGSTFSRNAALIIPPYQVVALVSTSDMCIGAQYISDTFTIKSIHGLPQINVLPVDTTVESGIIPETIFHTEVTGGTLPYSPIQWTPAIDVPIKGTTQFKATVTDSFGCSSSAVSLVRVTDSCLDSLTIRVTDGSEMLGLPLCSGTDEEVMIYAIVSGGQQKNTYYWEVDNGAVILEGQGTEAIKVRIPQGGFYARVYVVDTGSLAGVCFDEGYLTEIYHEHYIPVISSVKPTIKIQKTSYVGTTKFCRNGLDSLSLKSYVFPMSAGYTTQYFVKRKGIDGFVQDLPIGTSIVMDSGITIYSNSYPYPGGILSGDEFYAVVSGTPGATCSYDGSVESNHIAIVVDPVPALTAEDIAVGSLFSCSVDTPFIEFNLPLDKRDGLQYSIDSGITWEKSNIFKPVDTGTYHLALLSGDGCIFHYDGEVSVEIEPGVLPAPVAGTDTFYCAGEATKKLWANPLPPFITHWVLGDSVITGTHDYPVYYKSYNCVGEISTVRVTVYPGVKPVLNIVADRNLNGGACPEYTRFSAVTNVSDKNNINWYLNDILVATGAEYATDTLKNGDKIYAMSYVDSINKCYSSSTVTSNIINAILLSTPDNLVVYKDTTIEHGETAMLYAVANNAVSYQWQPTPLVTEMVTGKTDINNDSIYVRPSTTTTYTVVAKGANGCATPAANATVTVITCPIIERYLHTLNLCSGETLPAAELIAQIDGAGSLTWGGKIGGDGVRDTHLLIAQPTDPTCSRDSVYVVVIYDTGSSATASITVTAEKDSICPQEAEVYGIKFTANSSNVIWTRGGSGNGVIIGEDISTLTLLTDNFVEGEWIKATLKVNNSLTGTVCYSTKAPAIDSARVFYHDYDNCKPVLPQDCPDEAIVNNITLENACEAQDMTVIVSTTLTKFFPQESIIYNVTHTRQTGEEIARGQRNDTFTLSNAHNGDILTVEIIATGTDCGRYTVSKTISTATSPASPYYVEANDIIQCYIDSASISIVMPVGTSTAGYEYSIDSGRNWQESNYFKPVATVQGGNDFYVAIKTVGNCIWYDPMTVRINQIPDSCPPMSEVLLSRDTIICAGDSAKMWLSIKDINMVTGWEFEYSADSFRTAGIPFKGIGMPDSIFNAGWEGYYRAAMTGLTGMVYYSNVVKLSFRPTFDTTYNVGWFCWEERDSIPLLNFDRVIPAGFPDIATYTWYNNGAIVAGPSNTSSFQPPQTVGSLTYILKTELAPYGCVSYDTAIISLNPNLREVVRNFIVQIDNNAPKDGGFARDLRACPGNEISFIATDYKVYEFFRDNPKKSVSSYDTTYQVVWSDMPNEICSTSQGRLTDCHTGHIVEKDTTIVVTLTNTANGCFATDTVWVRVPDTIKVAIWGDRDTIICKGAALNLPAITITDYGFDYESLGLGNAEISIAWRNTDGSYIPSGINTTYEVGSMYPATVIPTDSVTTLIVYATGRYHSTCPNNIQQADTFTIYWDGWSPTNNIDDTTLCLGDTLKLPNGVNITRNTFGDTTYILKGNSPRGCEITDSITVRLAEPLPGSPVVEGGGCIGDTALFRMSAYDPGNYRVEWTIGGIVYPQDSVIRKLPSINTDIPYSAAFIKIGSTVPARCSEGFVDTIKVREMAHIVSGGDTTINACFTDSISLLPASKIAEIIGFYGSNTDITWHNSDGIELSGNNPKVKATNNGTYTITVSKSANCIITDTVRMAITDTMPYVRVPESLYGCGVEVFIPDTGFEYSKANTGKPIAIGQLSFGVGSLTPYSREDMPRKIDRSGNYLVGLEGAGACIGKYSYDTVLIKIEAAWDIRTIMGSTRTFCAGIDTSVNIDTSGLSLGEGDTFYLEKGTVKNGNFVVSERFAFRSVYKINFDQKDPDIYLRLSIYWKDGCVSKSNHLLVRNSFKPHIDTLDVRYFCLGDTLEYEINTNESLGSISTIFGKPLWTLYDKNNNIIWTKSQIVTTKVSVSDTSKLIVSNISTNSFDGWEKVCNGNIAGTDTVIIIPLEAPKPQLCFTDTTVAQASQFELCFTDATGKLINDSIMWVDSKSGWDTFGINAQYVLTPVIKDSTVIYLYTETMEGCGNFDSVVINIAGCGFALSVADTTVCRGTPVSTAITYRSGKAAGMAALLPEESEYLWRDLSGGIIPAATDTFTIIADSSNTYEVNVHGCPDDTLRFKVNVCDLSIQDTAICDFTCPEISLNLSAGCDTTGLNVTWQILDSFEFITSDTILVAINQPYIDTLRVRDYDTITFTKYKFLYIPAAEIEDELVIYSAEIGKGCDITYTGKELHEENSIMYKGKDTIYVVRAFYTYSEIIYDCYENITMCDSIVNKAYPQPAITQPARAELYMPPVGSLTGGEVNTAGDSCYVIPARCKFAIRTVVVGNDTVERAFPITAGCEWQKPVKICGPEDCGTDGCPPCADIISTICDTVYGSRLSSGQRIIDYNNIISVDQNTCQTVNLSKCTVITNEPIQNGTGASSTFTVTHEIDCPIICITVADTVYKTKLFSGKRVPDYSKPPVSIGEEYQAMEGCVPTATLQNGNSEILISYVDCKCGGTTPTIECDEYCAAEFHYNGAPIDADVLMAEAWGSWNDFQSVTLPDGTLATTLPDMADVTPVVTTSCISVPEGCVPILVQDVLPDNDLNGDGGDVLIGYHYELGTCSECDPNGGGTPTIECDEYCAAEFHYNGAPIDADVLAAEAWGSWNDFQSVTLPDGMLVTTLPDMADVTPVVTASCISVPKGCVPILVQDVLPDNDLNGDGGDVLIGYHYELGPCSACDPNSGGGGTTVKCDKYCAAEFHFGGTSIDADVLAAEAWGSWNDFQSVTLPDGTLATTLPDMADVTPVATASCISVPEGCVPILVQDVLPDNDLNGDGGDVLIGYHYELGACSVCDPSSGGGGGTQKYDKYCAAEFHFSGAPIDADVLAAEAWGSWNDFQSVTLPDGTIATTLPDMSDATPVVTANCISVVQGCIPILVQDVLPDNDLNGDGGDVLIGYHYEAGPCAAKAPARNKAKAQKAPVKPNLIAHRTPTLAEIAAAEAAAAAEAMAMNAKGKGGGPQKVSVGGGTANNPSGYDSEDFLTLPVFECYLDSVEVDTMVYNSSYELVPQKIYKKFQVCTSEANTFERGIIITSCKVDSIDEEAIKRTATQSMVYDPSNYELIGYADPIYSTEIIIVKATRFTCGIDSITYTDSITRVMKTHIVRDTVVEHDTCRPSINDPQAAQALNFCWRGECSNTRYEGLSARYEDSASKYRTEAGIARNNYANAAYTQRILALDRNDYAVAAYWDSVAEAYLQISRMYSAAAAAWTAAATRYLKREQITSYTLDTLHIKVTAILGGGCSIEDTITAVRIPLEYTTIPADRDTTLSAEREVQIDIYASNSILEWRTGPNAITALKHDITTQGGNINMDINSGFNKVQSDIKGSLGTETAPAGDFHAYTTYKHDTTHGDTFYFPFKVTNTAEFEALYGRTPSDARCFVNDSIIVNYVYGFKLMGYVAYNGHWMPSAGDNAAKSAFTDFHDNKGGSAWHREDDGDQMEPEGYDQDVWTSFIDISTPIQKKHLPIGNAWVTVTDFATGDGIDTVKSDEQGYYTISKLLPEGEYIITASSPDKTLVRLGKLGSETVSYIDGTDVSMVASRSVGIPVNVNNRYSMWIQAGDVDESRLSGQAGEESAEGFRGNDVSQVASVSVGSQQCFTDFVTNDDLPNWIYSIDTLKIKSDTTFMVRGIMRGDANRNYSGGEDATPTQMQKAARNSHRKIELYGYINAHEGEKVISLPIVALKEGTLTSFQMALPYSNAEIIGVETPNMSVKTFAYNPHYRGEDNLAMLWAVAHTNAQTLKTGDTLAVVTIKVDGSLRSNPNKYLQNEIMFYQAALDQTILDFEVGIPEIEIYYSDDTTGAVYDTMSKPEVLAESEDEDEITTQGNRGNTGIVTIVPNPASVSTDVTYNIDGSSIVTLQLYDMLGKLHRTLVYAQRQSGLYRRVLNLEGLAAGTYILRLEATTGLGKSVISTERIVVRK